MYSTIEMSEIYVYIYMDGFCAIKYLFVKLMMDYAFNYEIGNKCA